MIEIVELLDSLATSIEKNQLPARLTAEIIRSVAKGIKDRPDQTHAAAPYVKVARSISPDESVQTAFIALCWTLDNVERRVKLSIKPNTEAQRVAEGHELTLVQRKRFYLLTNLFSSIKEPGAYSRLVCLLGWFDDEDIYQALLTYVKMHYIKRTFAQSNA